MSACEFSAQLVLGVCDPGACAREEVVGEPEMRPAFPLAASGCLQVALSRVDTCGTVLWTIEQQKEQGNGAF